MKKNILDNLLPLFDALGLSEEPMGIYYTDEAPAEDSISPKPQTPVTREAETNDEIDWNSVMKNYSCILKIVWKARKKKVAAYFDRERFGCIGGAFYLGFMRPYLKFHPVFVSTGIPDLMQGERYFDSPEKAQEFFETINPRPAPANYCVIKPLSQFDVDEDPEFIIFFARPEVISGLNSLITFVTNDIEAVKSPFGPACSGLVTWPEKYLNEGKPKAVLGGFDPTCRKYFKTDEITFTVPTEILIEMSERWEESFLNGYAWKSVKKKIKKSNKIR